MGAANKGPTALREETRGPLAEEFAGAVPAGLVQAEVRRAEVDLRGEVPRAALPEFVYRLARERLCQHAHAGAAPSDLELS